MSDAEARLLEEQIVLADTLAQESDLLWRFEKPREGVETNTAVYYQTAHDEIKAYSENNWLLTYLPVILSVSPASVLEFGCGNGIATRALADRVERVIAVDWARNSTLEDLPANVQFIQGDIRAVDVPKVDVIASADVLEHFDPNDILETIKKINEKAHYNFHVIACYDDNHSHLAVADPGIWLALFKKYDSRYRLDRVEFRRSDPSQVVCVITNIPASPGA